MIMVGKAKANQEAKFTTLAFCGKSLKEDAGYYVTLAATTRPHFPPARVPRSLTR